MKCVLESDYHPENKKPAPKQYQTHNHTWSNAIVLWTAVEGPVWFLGQREFCCYTRIECHKLTKTHNSLLLNSFKRLFCVFPKILILLQFEERSKYYANKQSTRKIIEMQYLIINSHTTTRQ